MLSKARVSILFVVGFAILAIFWLDRSEKALLPKTKSKVGTPRVDGAPPQRRDPSSVESVEFATPASNKLLSFLAQKKGKLVEVDKDKAWDDFRRLFGDGEPWKVPLENLKQQCKAGLTAACWMASRKYSDDLSNLKSNIYFVSTAIEREELLKHLRQLETEAIVFNVAACSTGDSLSCRDARMNAGTPELKNALYELGSEFCEVGSKDYCSVVVEGKLKDVEQARSLLNCSDVCPAEDEMEIKKMADRAIDQGMKYCLSGDADSCGTLLWQKDLSDDTRSRAVSALSDKCGGDEPAQCDFLYFHFRDRGDSESARFFAERGCDKGQRQSCLAMLSARSASGEDQSVIRRVARYCRTLNEPHQTYPRSVLEMCEAAQSGELDDHAFWFSYSDTPVGDFGEPLSRFVHDRGR